MPRSLASLQSFKYAAKVYMTTNYPRNLLASNNICRTTSLTLSVPSKCMYYTAIFGALACRAVT